MKWCTLQACSLLRHVAAEVRRQARLVLGLGGSLWGAGLPLVHLPGSGSSLRRAVQVAAAGGGAWATRTCARAALRPGWWPRVLGHQEAPCCEVWGTDKAHNCLLQPLVWGCRQSRRQARYTASGFRLFDVETHAANISKASRPWDRPDSAPAWSPEPQTTGVPPRRRSLHTAPLRCSLRAVLWSCSFCAGWRAC